MQLAIQVRKYRIIGEKETRVTFTAEKYWEISEKKKHVEDLGHDVRTDTHVYVIGASVSEPPLVDSTDALSR